jgi:phosphoenolpyruvate-protein kinase (PTS system EI component)
MNQVSQMNRQTYRGQTASPGIALGVLHHLDLPPDSHLPRRPTAGDPVDQVSSAFDAVAGDLLHLSETLRTSGQIEQADIVEVNSYIAQDHELRAAAIRRVVDQRVNVSHAIAQAVNEYAGILAGLDDPTLAERAADVRQVGRRVLAHLTGAVSSVPEGPVVLIAHEVGATDLLEGGDLVVAAASVLGGPNSHASIIARSLGIPLILGIDPAMLDQPEGIEALVDADHASITVHPAADEREAAITAMSRARHRREVLAAERHLPCRTLDGHTIVLRANIATPVEAKTATGRTADGVGLLRTELPFLDAPAWPNETQHAAVLVPIFRKLRGQVVTVRTLDYADDKLPPFLAAGRHGQALGRGLPLMLAEPDAFAHQFRAILTAGADSDLKVLIPMVADADELNACKAILDRCAAELGVPTPPIGAMIELPEAVADADGLAAAAGFLSIGSNDLTCQLLRLDRRDPAATPAMTAHPVVLRAIAAVVAAGHRYGRQVSVCGDAAAHPLVAPLLIGLGCDVLSVAPAALDEVRARIRRLDMRTCAAAAEDAMACGIVEQVWQIATERCSPWLP